jgi:tryptophan 2,3-dioxygenase
MTTFIAKSHEAIEALQDMRDRLDGLIKAEAERAELAAQEEAALHARLAIANAMRLLSKIAKQSRVSDGDRQQISGVIRQLERAA